MKRPRSKDEVASASAPHKQGRIEEQSSKSDYNGYSFQKEEVVVDTVNTTIEAKGFFDKYIATRRPCVIQGSSLSTSPFNLSPDDLVKWAGDEMVQVEKRHSPEEMFGQNRTAARQINMKVSEFIEKVRQPEGKMYYLSTQQPSADSDEEPADPFQTPCRQLLSAKKLEPTLSWAKNLRLESCNLWMGSSVDGTCSGLHHDYHDNFYLLVEGQKTFDLFSPDTAEAMQLHGNIDKIHFNGVISYVGNETRADGTPVAAVPSSDPAKETDDEDDDDEEGGVEFVVGKGFDYQSSSDDEPGDEDFDEDGPDDFDELVGGDEEAADDADDEEDVAENVETRPNSFSRINLDTVDHKTNTAFAACRGCKVTLNKGDILYLPAGWMHNVTSFSVPPTDDSKQERNYHLAINYWYHPPDQLDSFESPYQHMIETMQGK